MLGIVSTKNKDLILEKLNGKIGAVSLKLDLKYRYQTSFNNDTQTHSYLPIPLSLNPDVEL